MLPSLCKPARSLKDVRTLSPARLVRLVGWLMLLQSGVGVAFAAPEFRQTFEVSLLLPNRGFAPECALGDQNLSDS
jgi:hypothetical protein